MNDLTIYGKYITKIGISPEMIFSSPAGISVVPIGIVAASISTPLKAMILLAVLFILDFITGIWASWIEFRNQQIKGSANNKYVVQSAKLRLSAIKFITYGMVILVAYGLEWVFVVQEFKPSDKIENLSLTTIAIIFCCAIEFYSVFFENIKRMGFDIILKIKKIASSGWDLYKTIKNDATG